MWGFLERWLAAAPREIAWVVVMPIPLLVVAVGCLLLLRLTPDSGIPETLVAAIGYAAGVKVLAIVALVTFVVIAAVGLAGLWLYFRCRRLF